jgi:hypothetical protein
MGRAISPWIWVGPGHKKVVKKYSGLFSPAQLAQLKNGSGWACPPGFGPARLKFKKKRVFS